MTTITFSSPKLTKTVQVNKAERNGKTVLSIAKEHGVPIPFNCEGGACSACLIDVDVVSERHLTTVELTEQEKLVLKVMGELTDEDIKAAQSEGVPPKCRLACQYRIGNEDIVVRFSSDLGYA